MPLSHSVALIGLILLTGCSAMQKVHPLLECDASYLTGKYSDTEIAAAGSVAVYAMLANNTYRANSRPQFNLPRRWEIIHRVDDEYFGFGVNLYGLRGEANQIKELVIAFRGTDDIRDWATGNFFAPQYRLADIVVGLIVAHYAGIPTVAVGHSLGGGLALHTSLRFDGINAFAFNTSPRIWTYGEKVKKNKRILVAQQGEPLGIVRKNWIETPNAEVLEYDFMDTDLHYSYPLARGLLMVGSLGNPDLKELLSNNCKLTSSK